MSNDKKVRTRAVFAMGLLAVVAMSVQAADYTWLANPLSANWLTDANWDQGVWDETATANKAIFGASAQTAVDVNGDVTVPSVAVSGADYAFGGTGTLTVNGSFNVAAGNTVTVNGPLAQKGAVANRFVKDGDGTLVVTGDSTFGAFSIHGGTVRFNGGMHVVTNKTTGAGETALALSLGKGTMVIEGGAVFKTTAGSTWGANSGVDLYVTNGVVDLYSTVNDFLNAFKDNNGSLSSRRSCVTIQDEGTMIVRQMRLSKADSGSYPDNANRTSVNLNRGGRLVARHFTMDETAGSKFYATVNFDGGTLALTNSASETGKISRFSSGDRNANKCWQNVHLYIKEGGLSLEHCGTTDSFLYKAFESGAAQDGGLHLCNKGCYYLYATNTYNGGTWLNDKVYCAIETDRSLGAVPASPTNNVFINSSSAFFHFGYSCDTHPNRTFLIAEGKTAQIGTYEKCIGRIRGAIVGSGENGEKSELAVVSSWPGITALAPEEGRTNKIGRLLAYGNLRIDSGTTLVTSNCAAQVGLYCPLLVSGGGSFSDTRGRLVIAGGTLKVTQNCYVQVAQYGQVIVTNGVLDLLDAREYLNGLSYKKTDGTYSSATARTTVSDKGEIWCKALRICQGGGIDSTTGLPATEVNVRTGGVVRLNNFYIDLNTTQKGLLNLDGGVSVARANTSDFLGTGHGKWLTNIIVRACAGGAIFDTTNHNISVKNPIFSGASPDGGLTKRGAGTLTMVSTNTYNGVTRLEGGKLVFSHAQGYPGGDLEIAAAAVQGALAAPLLTAHTLAFREGKGVRVTEADTLDDKTYGPMKTVATFTTPLAAVPSLTLVDADGTEWTDNKQWSLQLVDGGKTLKFGPLRGTQVIFR